MTDAPQVLDTPEFPVPLLAATELYDPGAPAQPWLWQGYLAPGKVTGFISQGKSGKTTLASILLARLQTGGTLAGLPLATGTALVVSEESPREWEKRSRHLGIGGNVRFLCRPFKGKRPTFPEWRALIDNIAKLHRQQRMDLVVIDPLGQFLAGAENSAPAMFDALLPLQQLADEGSAIWLLHHPCKKKQADGLKARGSVLDGFVDIQIEMSCLRRLRSTDRRRRLCAYSRDNETPRNHVIELNAEGTDYRVCTEETAVASAEKWPELMQFFERATSKTSCSELLQEWPADLPRPRPDSLLRWLKRAFDRGILLREGAGINHDPYRYWLPHRAAMMDPGPRAPKEERQAWNDRCLQEHMDRFGIAWGPPKP